MSATKLISILVGLLFFPLSLLHAQEKHTHEIGLGYGQVTYTTFSSFFADALAFPLSFGTYTTKVTQNSGALFFTYKYALSERWTIGGDFAWERILKDVMMNESLIGQRDDHTFTVALTGDFYYVSQPKLKLYSGIGIGYAIQAQEFNPMDIANEEPRKDHLGLLNVQISLLGLRMGGKFAFQTEIGYGYKGIISAGLRYQL